MKQPKLLKLVYLLFGGGLLALQLGAGTLGWEMSRGQRGKVPASVRSAPGGLHGYSFWYLGYRGGK